MIGCEKSRSLTVKSGNKTCAWFMTHRPTPDQRADLESRGYEIIHISAAVQAYSAERMLEYINECIENVDLIVAVMPAQKLTKLAHIAPIPVLTAKMQSEKTENGTVYHWSGKWLQIVGVSIKTTQWG